MPDFTELLQIFRTYLIEGSFFSVLFIILLSKSRLKNETVEMALQLIKWVLIVYSVTALLYLGFTLTRNLDPETVTLRARCSGVYGIYYWSMAFCGFSPLILLIKKIGRRRIAILTTAFLANIGVYFEWFVIHVTSIHRDFVGGGLKTLIPRDAEFITIGLGICVGILLLTVSALWHKNKTRILRK